MTALAVVFVFPAVVDAQVVRVRFDDVLVGADGHTQVHLGTTPTGSSVQLFNPDGTVRAQLASGGGAAHTHPPAPRLDVFFPNGRSRIQRRLGRTAPPPLAPLSLRDRQGAA